MKTKDHQIIAEITRLVNSTNSGVLQWERVPGLTCTYQTDSMHQHLIVSCCQPECWIELGNRRVDVSCEDLMPLCSEIIRQVRQSEVQKDETIAVLRTINTLVENSN
jgi:hypothetical protein